jgi:hypothetical protein
VCALLIRDVGFSNSPTIVAQDRDAGLSFDSFPIRPDIRANKLAHQLLFTIFDQLFFVAATTMVARCYAAARRRQAAVIRPAARLIVTRRAPNSQEVVGYGRFVAG